MRLCKFPKFFDSYYNMLNIPGAMCAHCDFFIGSVFRLRLSYANVEPRLIIVEENIQDYFKVSLRLPSCCMLHVCFVIWKYVSIVIYYIPRTSPSDICIWSTTKCRKVWSRLEPQSLDDESHPCIEFCDLQITYVLLTLQQSFLTSSMWGCWG